MPAPRSVVLLALSGLLGGCDALLPGDRPISTEPDPHGAVGPGTPAGTLPRQGTAAAGTAPPPSADPSLRFAVTECSGLSAIQVRLLPPCEGEADFTVVPGVRVGLMKKGQEPRLEELCVYGWAAELDGATRYWWAANRWADVDAARSGFQGLFDKVCGTPPESLGRVSSGSFPSVGFTDVRFRTADGLGVGSPIKAVERALPGGQGWEEEDVGDPIGLYRYVIEGSSEWIASNKGEKVVFVAMDL